MSIKLRDYQLEAVENAMGFLFGKSSTNGIIICPTGGGKSWIVAEIAKRLNDNVIVFCPSREILAQNFEKMETVFPGISSIYSASFNKKEISRITFATIGSVKAHMEDFNHFRYIIVDECHTCNPQGGMYRAFFDCAERKILGLTATPYRLYASLQYLDWEGKQVFRPKDEEKSLEFDQRIASRQIRMENKCILKFLTRMRPRIFHDVIYQVDISTLLQRGYLATLRYFDLSIMTHAALKRNSTGMDFDDDALKAQYDQCNLSTHLINIVRRLQRPKDGRPRKGILVFTRFIEESELLCEYVEGCAIITGSTPKKERERILKEFKKGKIKVVTNVGVLTTGFDYPELDTVVMARPTMSLALYYQIVGRAIRPHPDKESSWIVDICGNYKRFGRVEDLHLQQYRSEEYIITGCPDNQETQLTNVYF